MQLYNRSTGNANWKAGIIIIIIDYTGGFLL